MTFLESHMKSLPFQDRFRVGLGTKMNGEKGLIITALTHDCLGFIPLTDEQFEAFGAATAKVGGPPE